MATAKVNLCVCVWCGVSAASNQQAIYSVHTEKWCLHVSVYCVSGITYQPQPQVDSICAKCISFWQWGSDGCHLDPELKHHSTKWRDLCCFRILSRVESQKSRAHFLLWQKPEITRNDIWHCYRMFPPVKDLEHAFPPQTSAKGEFYIKLLHDNVWPALRRKPYLLQCCIFLQGSVTPHCHWDIQDLLWDWEILAYSPYSSCCLSCTLQINFVFVVKELLEGCSFEAADTIKNLHSRY